MDAPLGADPWPALRPLLPFARLPRVPCLILARPSLVPPPQALYAEGERRLDALDGFVRGLEDRILPLLREGKVPQKDLVQAIAAAKVREGGGRVGLVGGWMGSWMG